MMRRTTTIAAAIALLAGATGCGSEDEQEQASPAPKPSRLAIELSGSGKDLTFTVPKSAKGGLVEMTFTNSTKNDASAQLVGAEAGHTPQEALEAGAGWGESGKPLPTWVKLAGGFGSVKPGQTATITQQLPAGDYVVADLDSNTNASLKVSGESGAKEPSTPAKVTASEYEFTSSGLEAGRQRFLFDNAGAEPHFIAAVPIKPGKTIADVRRFLKSEKGEPPIDEESSFSTAIVDGGVKQTLEADFKSGTYALLCFVPDRKGGPPHVVKGMISEATVR